MREIKFRAWDLEKGAWFILRSGLHNVAHIVSDGSAATLELGRDDLIIQQYTGRKDKNGKEIYTGDLLRPTHERHTDKIGEVRTESGGFQVYTRCHWPDWFETYPMRSAMFDDMQYEIIGNIYENPDILE